MTSLLVSATLGEEPEVVVGMIWRLRDCGLLVGPQARLVSEIVVSRFPAYEAVFTSQPARSAALALRRAVGR